ncbi:PIN/TRAM domain-containing protein [Latilactobacillus curvatus]|uniref:PIN/TRAM domain-containing protein n=1 Tax=Latilactobacillus curvatus TaxID=28038 RepID=UPI00241171F8|nr:PIN/TRAM domain-containing protein [Latilactobacillus curvatus]MDG2979420.1 PIN/TRAM domain-containing protein [Latilactobacillus curvatus]MDT3393836.1 PIN/TRAM domain-containing protein [Bacillota bacterium]
MQQKRFTKKRILGIVFIILGGALGITAFPVFWPLVHLEDMMYLNNGITNAILGAIIFYLLFLALATPMLRAMHRIEKALTKQSPSFILFGSVFSLIGLLLANVVSIPLYRMPIFALNTVVPILLMIALGYLGFRIGTTRMEEWRRLMQPKKRNADVLERKVGDNFRKYKILDTSVIIDGRIKEIAKTGFIEGTLMVPNFVLHELQLISDSADNLKRARGRRGLDILNDIQKDDSLSVEMYDGDFEDLTEVDSKLVKLAKLLDGIVVTNDYNLNKVCEFQNVPVFNINQLANTLKPAVLPGEAMTVTVVKAGTERQQGVAYLDDGTMIVVEDGQHYLNKPLEVIVTSALQTAAGRMIFARPAHQQKGLKEK